jgi:hypothetical protein
MVETYVRLLCCQNKFQKFFDSDQKYVPTSVQTSGDRARSTTTKDPSTAGEAVNKYFVSSQNRTGNNLSVVPYNATLSWAEEPEGAVTGGVPRPSTCSNERSPARLDHKPSVRMRRRQPVKLAS